MIGIIYRILALAPSGVVRPLRDLAPTSADRAHRALASNLASSRQREKAFFRRFLLAFLAVIAAAILSEAQGQVPNLLNYQGRVLVRGTAFTGTGQFKFTLVSGNGTQNYWSNSADNNNDGQPDISVPVAVNGGLFSVSLGDTNLSGMAALPVSVFTNGAVHLRIWFNDGTNGFYQLTPDQPLTSAAYAMMTANVADGTITAAKLAANTANEVTAAVSARVDGLTTQVAALANQLNSISNQSNGLTISGSTAVSMDPRDAVLQGLGFQLFTAIAAPGWTTSSASGTPSAAAGQAGVWTGQELLVWGGSLGAGNDSGSGAGYRPDLDTWQPIPAANAPSARDQHTAIWSGQEMIVWGGASAGSFVNTGGRFNPSNQNWTSLSTNSAPTGRIGHVAGWTGSRMIVWGGRNNFGVLGDGASYDPLADQWVALALANAPSPRVGATVVLAGNRLVVWGGQDQLGTLNTGSQLILSTNGVPTAWVRVTATNAPASRTGHSAIWTGQKMLVWGGQSGGNFVADGAAYDPVADTWSSITLNSGPTARSSHSAVWSGQEMLVFGGEAYSGTLSDGAAYDPLPGKWRALSGTGNPQARSGATAAWSGMVLLVFGGLASGAPVPSLQSLNPQPTWYFYRKP